MGTCIAFIMLGLLATSGQGNGDRAREDLKLLQGVWHGVSLESGGKTAPADFVQKGRYVFKGNTVTIFEGDKKLGRGKVVLDTSSSPKAIDLIALDGPDKGKTTVGIYKIEGDTLTLCIGGKRPTEFSGAGEDGLAKFKHKKSRPATSDRVPN